MPENKLKTTNTIEEIKIANQNRLNTIILFFVNVIFNYKIHKDFRKVHK
ncbi:hypothetical protein FPSM_00033 [Flavobacterium psychrophilum]|nr:hypothetical protein FPSM_00033 [Flavobacterium psychrophilum]